MTRVIEIVPIKKEDTALMEDADNQEGGVTEMQENTRASYVELVENDCQNLQILMKSEHAITNSVGNKSVKKGQHSKAPYHVDTVNNAEGSKCKMRFRKKSEHCDAASKVDSVDTACIRGKGCKGKRRVQINIKVSETMKKKLYADLPNKRNRSGHWVKVGRQLFSTNIYKRPSKNVNYCGFFHIFPHLGYCIGLLHG